MEATVGGSGGILLNPSLETGKGEEENLERWTLRYLWIQGTGTRQEQEQDEEKIIRMFFQRSEVMKKEHVRERVHNSIIFLEIRDHWDRIYKWIIVLMVFIDTLKN